MNSEQQADKTCPEEGGLVEVDGLIWSLCDLGAVSSKISGTPAKCFPFGLGKLAIVDELADRVE